MKNDWNYFQNIENLKAEKNKYYNYFESNDLHTFLSKEIQLQEYNPQKVFNRKKHKLIQTYDDFLSRNAIDKFLNNEIIQSIIRDKAPLLEDERDELLDYYSLDSFNHHLNELKLNSRKKIRKLHEPSEHFEKRGRFLIHMMIPLLFTLLFFIVFSFLGVTFQNATDSVFTFGKIIFILGGGAVILFVIVFILSSMDFSSNKEGIGIGSIIFAIGIALFAGICYLCDRFIRPTQGDYRLWSLFMTILLFSISLLISEIAFVPSSIIKRIYSSSESFKEDTDSRYYEYMLKNENMEILTIALYLDDILHVLIESWLNDERIQSDIRNIILDMNRLLEKAKKRANDTSQKYTNHPSDQPGILS